MVDDWSIDRLIDLLVDWLFGLISELFNDRRCVPGDLAISNGGSTFNPFEFALITHLKLNVKIVL